MTDRPPVDSPGSERLSESAERTAILNGVARAIDTIIADPKEAASLQPSAIIESGNPLAAQEAWTDSQREQIRGIIRLKLRIREERIEKIEAVVASGKVGGRVEIPIPGVPFSLYVQKLPFDSEGDREGESYIGYSLERPAGFYSGTAT